MGRIGPRRNRRVVAGPAAGPMGPMTDRTPNLQPAAMVKCGIDKRKTGRNEACCWGAGRNINIAATDRLRILRRIYAEIH